MEIKIIVFTPAGPLKVDSISQAQEYKTIYGWFYRKIYPEDEDYYNY